MKDQGEKITPIETGRRLHDAMRDVKNAMADRDDVVIELREAERMRLELLLQELEPVIAEVPSDAETFDLTISSGLQPRLWIDATAHVAMGRDKRIYRFLRDGRMGRIVLAESHDMKPVAEQVTRYIAERLLERERMMNGAVPLAVAEAPRVAPDSGGAVFWSAIGLFLSGAVVGVAVALAVFWNSLPTIHLQY